MVFKDIEPKTLPLSQYEFKLNHPFGVVEEGLFEYLMSVAPPAHAAIVEFGTGEKDGFALSKSLVERHDFSAVLVGANEEIATALAASEISAARVKAIEKFENRDGLAGALRASGIPQNLAILCIDINGNDLHIWQALANEFKPDFVCIEFNGSWGADKEFAIPYSADFEWAGDDYFGASFATLVAFGESQGYRLIHCTSAGDNLIFAREGVAEKFPSSKLPARDLYQVPQYGKNGRAPNGKGHPVSKHGTSALERLWFKTRYTLMAIPRKIVYANHDPKGHSK
jgi:hypothetical protein